jgi:putative transposase
VNWFRNLWEAREKVEAWRREYNEARPHSSLGYQTPAAFAANQAAPPASPPTLAGTLKTEENASSGSTNFVSENVRT